MDAVAVALTQIAQPIYLLMLVCGVVAGLVVGVIPGIGGIFGIALLIPLTYQLDPYAAFALLLGMGSVVATSDTIPAVLFGVPGTVGAAATVLDGHQMAKKGESARAFGAAYSASLIGGLFGALILALSIPIMRPLVLLLQTPDFFAISAFGLSIVAMLAGSQPLKGFAAVLLGILVSFIGLDEHTGFARWTFGQVYLWEGLPIVVVFLGLFGLPELAALLARGAVQSPATPPAIGQMLRGVRDTFREWALVLRCSSIGAALGAVPGVGVSVIDWIAYGHAARRPGSGPPFGEGNVRGVIAPESANNAKEGGALIPTIAFGVPGSASMSVLLGAFVIHGLVPGPEMLTTNASVTLSMVFTIAIANILGAGICLMLTRPLSSIARVPAGIIVPSIVAFIAIGSFQTSMSALDFVILIALGMLGVAMKELNWPRPAFALGFVLGPILERYFFLAHQIWGWSWLGRPLVLVMLGLGALTIVRQAIVRRRSERPRHPFPASLPDVAMGLLVTGVAVFAFLGATRFPQSAGLFPGITSALLTVAAGTVTIAAAYRLLRGSPGMVAAGTGDGPGFADGAARSYAAVFAMAAAMAVMVLAVGHLIASFVFLAVAIPLSGRRSWIASLAVAAATTAAIAGVFDLLVSQPWPRPWLAPVLGALYR